MEILGIVAEYDPFHQGHLYHIEKSREETQCEGVVCLMSGDFTQRGGPALLDKFARSEMAVRSGADLVVELPLPWCMAGAESFARGAVGLLTAMGCVNTLSFGSESGNAQELMEISALLLSSELEEALGNKIKEGLPFALARQQAVAIIKGEEYASLLSRPNNILGIEYGKAILLQHSPLQTLTIKRTSSEHNGQGSASELRASYARGENILSALPKGAREVLIREEGEGKIPHPKLLELALLSRLRMMIQADFHALPDCSEGLENRLYKEARRGSSLEEILHSAHSKRYPRARLRRILWNGALHIRKGDDRGTPPYIRPLCANKKGQEILRLLKKSATLPVLSRSGAVKSLDEPCRSIFEKGSNAHDFYVLGRKEGFYRQSDEDWQKNCLFI